MENAITSRTDYITRRKDGTDYTLIVTPYAYTIDGVTFATMAAALDAARAAHERTVNIDG